jgi:hypothetical protein
VSVKDEPPATTTDGLILVIVGVGGAATTNHTTAELSLGPLVTLISALMGFAIAPAGTTAVIDVDEPNIVAKSVLPKHTCDAFVKFAPVTDSVNAAPPATAPAGLKVAIVGAGASVTLNRTTFELFFDPLTTPILTLAGFAISSAVTFAVNDVADIKVVDKNALPNVTWDDAVKFVPVIDKVKPAPSATADAGIRLVIAGVGGDVTSNGTRFEFFDPLMTPI